MANKEIRFSARLDDTQLNQDIANLQKKLKDIQSESNRASQGMKLNNVLINQGMPAMSQYGQQQYQQTYNSANAASRQVFMAEVEQLKKLGEIREGLTKKLERQNKIQEMLKAQGKDLLEIDERRADTAERLASAKTAESNQAEKLIRVGEKGLRPDIRSPNEMYGPPSAPGGKLSDMIGALGGAATVIAGIAKAVSVGTGLYRAAGEAPVIAAAAQGSAIQGTYGREVEAIYSGRAGVEAAFMPEKMKATTAAMQMLRRRQQTQALDIAAHIAAGTWGGAAAGGIGGAAIAGIPSLGIAAPAGAAAGGILGGIGGFLGTSASVLSDKSNLYTLLEGMGVKSAGQARQGMLLQEFAENYNKARQGLVEQNPYKKAAAEQYNSNWERYLQFQRQTGLDYETFHGAGGFRGNATAAGFTDAEAMGISGQILSAGGSTGGAGSKNSVLALQAQRNFNLTNAGSIFGKLSSVNANQEENKAALVRILAEGTKLGFDGSHYVEESRKFTQTVSEIVSRTGGSTQEDAARAGRAFGSFVADPTTTAGIEAARSMYDKYQQMSSQTSGARGVLRAAGFLSNPILRNLSQETRINLAGVKEEDLNSENALVQLGARQAGVKPEDLIENIREVNRRSMTRRPVERYRKELQKWEKTNGPMSGSRSRMVGGRAQELHDLIISGLEIDMGAMTPQEQESAFTRFMADKSVERNTLPTKKNAAMIRGGMSAADQVEAKLLSTAPTGRPEDETQRLAAESADQMLKSFRSMREELVPSAAAVHAFNEELRKTVEIIAKMPGGADKLASMFGNQFTGGQEQGGTPTPGAPGIGH